MPFGNRPYEVDGNQQNRQRMFRGLPDFKQRGPRNGSNSNYRQRQSPPEATNAENFYYIKQMNTKTPMVIVMTDGEEIRGCIEWYDRNALKVNRDGAPNLLIQKHCIKYLF